MQCTIFVITTYFYVMHNCSNFSLPLVNPYIIHYIKKIALFDTQTAWPLHPVTQEVSVRLRSPIEQCIA